MADTPDDLPPDQDAADEAARRVYAEHADELADHVADAEKAIDDAYKKISSDVRELVRVRGQGASARTVANDTQTVLEASLVTRLKTIRATIRTATKIGPAAARKTFRVVYGDQVIRTQVRATVGALEEAAERIAGRTTVDGVGLSKRLIRRDAEVVQTIKREVGQIFTAKEGILDAAERIAQVDVAEAPKRLPKYLQEMADAARGGDKKALQKAVKRHARYINSLGEMQPDGTVRPSQYSLRGSSKRFASQIQKATGEDIDKLIAKNLEERAAYRARVIARHEANEALRSSYIESTRNKPGVVCYAFTLSNRHPRADICDVHAGANAHGLGPGRYPADEIPKRHPMCLCAISAVTDLDHFKRPEGSPRVPDDFKDSKSPDAHSWLKANPDIGQRVAGPTRWSALQRGESILDAEQQFIPVRSLVGIREAAE